MNDGITIGLDLAKNVFQVHGVGDGGAVMISKRLRRRQVVPFFKKRPSCLIGVEACAKSHPWARELGALANKNARTAWTLLANGEAYRQPAAAKA